MNRLTALLIALPLLYASTARAADVGYEKLVKGTSNKVVTIEVRGIGPKLEFADLLMGTTGHLAQLGVLGSGSILTGDGVILTCDHLFDAKWTDVRILVKDANGKKYKAILLDEDKDKDLATLKIFPLHTMSHFQLGKPLQRGQRVLSFGSPLGYTNTVSFGYVSNTSAKDQTRYRTMHTASINPGNSGGPLVDEGGLLVGVNIETAVVNMFQTAEAMHLAVTLKDIHTFLGE